MSTLVHVCPTVRWLGRAQPAGVVAECPRGVLESNLLASIILRSQDTTALSPLAIASPDSRGARMTAVMLLVVGEA